MNVTNRHGKCSIYTSFEEERKRETEIKMILLKDMSKDNDNFTIHLSYNIQECDLPFLVYHRNRRMLLHLIPQRKRIDEAIRHTYNSYHPSWCVAESVLRLIGPSTSFSHSWLFLILITNIIAKRKIQIEISNYKW